MTQVKLFRSGNLRTIVEAQYVTVYYEEGYVFYRDGVPTTVRIPDYTICSIPRRHVKHFELLGRDSLLGLLYREEFRGTR